MAWVEEQRVLLTQQLAQEIKAMTWGVAEKMTFAIGVLEIVFWLHCGLMHILAPSVN